jgi:hypothetical protein
VFRQDDTGARSRPCSILTGERAAEADTWLRDTTADGPYLDIRRNHDPKTAKLRVHLDVAPYPSDDWRPTTPWHRRVET